jgi:hypothetical protein
MERKLDGCVSDCQTETQSSSSSKRKKKKKEKMLSFHFFLLFSTGCREFVVSWAMDPARARAHL